MESFDLINIDLYAAHFPAMPLNQLRAFVEDAVSEMKWEFDGREAEVEDWATGGWFGKHELMLAYANWRDHSEAKIRRLQAFEKLMDALARRENAELKAALSLKHAA